MLAALLAGTSVAGEELRHAGLVVRHGDGRIVYAYVAFPEESISGVELLRRSGISLVTIGFGAVVGALDELYQKGVPGRNSDPRDWMMDVAAVSISVLLTQLVRTRSIGTHANGGATSR